MHDIKPKSRLSYYDYHKNQKLKKLLARLLVTVLNTCKLSLFCCIANMILESIALC